MRQPNSNSHGRNFDQVTIELVWRKGQPILGYNPNEIRKDSCEAWIKRADYGNTNSQWGWEIDHDYPVSKGGSDDLRNLQPLQWENNRHKSDSYPYWQCAVRAS
ncbi:MAG: HNH endonuclease domain-containing protein [Nostoc sp. DedQUE12b]|uniref:HNH endonuclease domain-containing protein n=1 Tax=Nostoc sp. DedQUE12b TaxID=3075398 RepID=UPI002AD571DF|nr:HNH endonuclease domain-containing protein [Nostoc sp. DedQUE12b]MDZ8089960.1 HNH endonuclease domain-containing protein [Nostoc sp. DedQUE12b]